MILGISYNLFDGDELLTASIKSIRDQVDHISVVYQTVSNFGQPCSPTMEALLHDLVNEKLIDDLIFFPTNLNVRPSKNETKKRNLGLQLAKRRKCTHFMTMDSDEFYLSQQLQQAKAYIENEKIACSVVEYVNYINEPIYQIARDPQALQYVPFIGKVGLFSKIKRNAYFPSLLTNPAFRFAVDPTRRFNGRGKFHIFDPQTILMHHMWAVRHDLKKKFNNSTMNTQPEKRTQKRREAIAAWAYGKPFCIKGQSPRAVNKVDNIFNIDISSPREST